MLCQSQKDRHKNINKKAGIVMSEVNVENGRLTVFVPAELDDHSAGRIREQVDRH